MAQINDTTALWHGQYVAFPADTAYYAVHGYLPAQFATIPPPAGGDNAFAPWSQPVKDTAPEPFAGYGEIETRARSLLDIDLPMQG